MQYHIWTIGCQMNVVDSQRVAAELERLGYSPAAQAEDADIILLNTCVVRQQPEDKAVGRLNQIKRVKAAHPERILALMGCMVGRREAERLAARFPWVDLFLPPSDPTALWDLLAARGHLDEAQLLIAEAEGRRSAALLPPSEQGKAVSAYIPIVLGCSHACTYCVIPYRRGAECSRPPEVILAEARQLVAQGVREITLLGQIVDRYGYDLPAAAGASLPLVALLRELHAIEGLARIRFLTSHPNWMRDELLCAVAELPKVCEHIEVPVQAGDDTVLEAMQRGYTVAAYRQLVARIRELLPGASIATDIIVGFPGETDEQFQHTCDLLQELRLDKAHIARYSARPQTVATRQMRDALTVQEKEQRRKRLDELQTGILTELNAQYLGQTVEVLVEGQKQSPQDAGKRARWFGRTRTDRLVFFESDTAYLGQLAQVRITWSGPWSLLGEAQSAQNI